MSEQPTPTMQIRIVVQVDYNVTDGYLLEQAEHWAGRCADAKQLKGPIMSVQWWFQPRQAVEARKAKDELEYRDFRVSVFNAKIPTPEINEIMPKTERWKQLG